VDRWNSVHRGEGKMNAQRHVLPEIEVTIENVGDALRAILHSILLSRALGEITPRAGMCKYYPTLCFAKCSDGEMEIESLIERIKKPAERRPIGPDLSRAEIVVSFYERRERTGLMGLVSTEEKVYWEHWFVPVVVNTRSGADIQREESGVRSTILRIAILVNERSDHLPHSPSHPETIFPFEMKLASDNESAKSAENPWFIARMLQQARPPSLT